MFQKVEPVKREMAYQDRLAIGSTNCHKDTFGQAFAIRRDGRESEMAFALGQEAAQIYGVEEMPRPSERQLRIRNSLFQGTNGGPAAPR